MYGVRVLKLIVVIMGTLCVALCAGAAESISGATNTNMPPLVGEYLGQKRPNLIPEVFAENIISRTGNHEFGVTFSPDRNEFYFSRREPDKSNVLYFTQQLGGYWSRKEQLFSDIVGASEPHISPDGKRLFFGTPNKLYMSLATDQGWSSPTVVGAGMYVSATADNDIYYTKVSPSQFSIVKRMYTDGAYSKEVHVSINGFDNENVSHPFIFPDEDFLVVNISGDLFISHPDGDKSWSRPHRLNDLINTPSYEFAPYLSPDEKYFFFSRSDEDGTNIYWVDAQVLFD